MAITPLSTDLAVIAALADLPNATSGLTAAQLKAKFDEGPTAIKTYINSTMIPEIDAEITSGGDALTTHKTSSDHDGRYYTETELNAGQLDTRYYTETESDAKYETITDLTTNRKLSATGDFTGTLNGYSIVAADPGLSSAFSALLADLAISPEQFSGTDYEKVQSAITYAIANLKAIRLARMYDVTNVNPLYIDKSDDRWALQFFGVGGGLKKTNTGFMFSSNSSYVGDINFNAVKFESVAGAGTKLFNAGKIIRLFSLGCIYRNVDTLVYTSDAYIQSYRFTGDSIVGGSGNAIETPGAFDLVLSSVLVEHRENFFKQLKDTASSFPSLYNVTFRDVNVEGLTGLAYSFCNINLLTIDGGYLELNALGDIYFDPTGTYVAVSISNLRSQQATGNPNSLCIIKWGGTVQEAKVFNVVGVEVPVSDTTAIVTGYITTENERVQGTGIVRNIDPAAKLIKYRSSTDYTDASGISTSQFGMFRRLKTSKAQTLTASVQNVVIVTFPEAIFTDDIISIQMIRPASLSQEVILGSYNKSGSTIEIWIKNNYTSSVAITLHVTVLKPFYSVTG